MTVKAKICFVLVKSQPFMKMDPLITVQCIKPVKAYFKNGDSNMITFRAIRGDCGAHNLQTTQPIGKIKKRYN